MEIVDNMNGWGKYNMRLILALFLPASILHVTRWLVRNKRRISENSLNEVIWWLWDTVLINVSACLVVFLFLGHRKTIPQLLIHDIKIAVGYCFLSVCCAALQLAFEYSSESSIFEMLQDHPEAKKKQKSSIITAITLVLMVLMNGMVALDDFTSVSTGQYDGTAQTVTLQSGNTITQEITVEQQPLKAISVKFSTLGRTNHCTIDVMLRDQEGYQYQNWTVDGRKLRDNSYYIFKLDNLIWKDNPETLFLEFYSDTTEEEAVVLCKNTTADMGRLLENGEQIKGASLCYQLQYKKLIPEQSLFYIQRYVFLSGLTIMLWLVLMRRFRATIVKAFLCLWISLSLMYACSGTLFSAPDEPNHFFRAYEVSMGHMQSEYSEALHYGGRELPFDYHKLAMLGESWESFEENKALSLEQDLKFLFFSNTALYAPVSYIPQAIGIFLARMLSKNVAFIAYAGRAANWLSATILLCLSIKILPKGKEFLALSMLMPMNLHQAVTLAPDGMVVALSMFIIAYVLNIRQNQTGALTPKQIAILYSLAIVICLYKIVYLPFCLYYFLLPAERFRSGMKEKHTHAIILVLLVSILSIGWLKSCCIFLNHRGADSTIQLQYLVKHPVEYWTILIRTLFNQGDTLIFQMIGSHLGKLNVPVPVIFMLAYLIYLIHVGNIGLPFQREKDLGARLISVIVILAIVLLISTSLYLQWTKVSYNQVEGLQGRYFIALLLPFYLAFTKNTGGQSKGDASQITLCSQWMILAINLCACMNLLLSCLRHP